MGDRSRQILDSRPQLTDYEGDFWNIYWEVGTCRPPSMGGATLIPITALFEYAKFYRMTDEESDRLIRIIRAMDNAYVSARAVKDRKAQEAAK